VKVSVCLVAIQCAHPVGRTIDSSLSQEHGDVERSFRKMRPTMEPRRYAWTMSASTREFTSSGTR
jgi:hypothetical protein